jgi:sortase A
VRRRLLRLLSLVLIAGGALLLIDGALTLLWKEPVSAVYSSIQQSQLSGELEELERAPVPVAERKTIRRQPDPARRLAVAAHALDGRAKEGQAIGRIRIGSVGISDVVVAGTKTDSLRRGPGHYPATPLPGQRGTVAIAGHRTTFGAPFRKLNKVRPGSTIAVEMPYGRFRYRVERTRIVKPDALWITQPVSYDRLVLSACHPLYSAAQRIVVFARLIDATPRGVAAA